MKETILLVDDAKFARKIALRSLHNGGFDNVIQAVDAAQAMNQFETMKPDLVLLDITLPDNSDLTLLEQMIKERPEAKIIMTSAIGQELIIQDALTAGAKAFIIKPYTEKEFLKIIFDVLEAKAGS